MLTFESTSINFDSVTFLDIADTNLVKFEMDGCPILPGHITKDAERSVDSSIRLHNRVSIKVVLGLKILCE